MNRTQSTTDPEHSKPKESTMDVAIDERAKLKLQPPKANAASEGLVASRLQV